MVGTMATLLYFGIVDYEEGNKISDFLKFILGTQLGAIDLGTSKCPLPYAKKDKLICRINLFCYYFFLNNFIIKTNICQPKAKARWYLEKKNGSESDFNT